LHKDFDLIFTHSAKILDNFDNARFVPFAASIWVKDLISDDAYTRKTKDISFLSSKKLMCPMHKYRYDLAYQCKNEKLADTYGNFDGGPFADLETVLKDYRYTICIENEIQPYYFSERLINAFAMQTIPVYVGATQIDKFFNPDGIIKLSPKDDIKNILKQCSKEEYERRLPAVLDNYKRALTYNNPYEYMYNKYLKDIY
jgi:hypothetical protein